MKILSQLANWINREVKILEDRLYGVIDAPERVCSCLNSKRIYEEIDKRTGLVHYQCSECGTWNCKYN